MKGKPRSVRKAQQTGSSLHQEHADFVRARRTKQAAWDRLNCAQQCGLRERAAQAAARREAIRNMKMPSHPRPLTQEEYLDKASRFWH